VLPQLERTLRIDRFDEARAHDFVWKHRRAPYDLVVYQLGNAPCHDYMWAYLAAYPGLVVLHDARLHHARARCLLGADRADDYRREFWYDHPEAPKGFVEYAVAGLGGPIYYFWSMLRVVMRTARLIAVHNDRVAAALGESFPDTPIETIRLGKAAPSSAPGARARVRETLGISERSPVFAAFGKLTAEKRIAPIVRACSSLVKTGFDAHLLLVGDGSELGSDGDALAASRRIHVTGHVTDEAIGDYLEAADACLCLRWPTALETSASWLHCLAARKATVISDLAHLVDIPPSVAMRVELVDEDESLFGAMRQLAEQSALRDELAAAGHAYWKAHHTIEATASDYRRVIDLARARTAPVVADLPPHFVEDCTSAARERANRFGLTLDILRAGTAGGAGGAGKAGQAGRAGAAG
jgi:glycosyltransferase involved in cell wall biosynthesis